MATSAILVMAVALLVIWGGLLVSVVAICCASRQTKVAVNPVPSSSKPGQDEV